MSLEGNLQAELSDRVIALSQRVKQVKEEKSSASAGYNGVIKDVNKQLNAILEALKVNDEQPLLSTFGPEWRNILLPASVVEGKKKKGA